MESPSPLLSASPLTASSTFSPAVSSTRSSPVASPEQYWPRLTGAIAFLLFAASLHVWVVRSPEPQTPPYAVLASRLVSPLLASPPMPGAPPFRLAAMPRAARATTALPSVTVETTLLRIAPRGGLMPPGVVQSSHGVLAAVGTAGHLTPAVLVAPAPAETPYDGQDGTVEPAHEARPMPAAMLGNGDDGAPGEAAAIVAPTVSAPAPLQAAARRPVANVTSAALVRARYSDEDDVRRVLADYTSALERLDVGAAKAVYPSVDDRRLRRAFEGLEQQQVHFQSCVLSITSSGTGASARCTGDATYRPKVGSRIRLTDREWNFSLSRGGGGWQIVDARMQ